MDILSKVLGKLGLQKRQASAPPPQLLLLDPNTIQVDADTYQFRGGGDAKGVTANHELTATEWNPILHGDPLIVHERLDGTMFVADGHHRLDLAKTLNEQGRGPGQVAAYVLREKDGYSAKDVRLIAAYKNFAQEPTPLLEVARVFQEVRDPQVHQEWLPQLDMSKGNLRSALMLSTALSSGALNYAIDHQLSEQAVVDVAAHVRNPKQQEIAMHYLAGDIPPQIPPMSFVERLQQQRQQMQFASQLAR